jgi:hypothetical protein
MATFTAFLVVMSNYSLLFIITNYSLLPQELHKILRLTKLFSFRDATGLRMIDFTFCTGT